MTQPPHLPASITIDPPLAHGEIVFLAGFSSRGDIRRVWPGQPNAHCPWRVSDDGRSLDLDLDLAREEPAAIAPWLRFLCQEFLAPSSIEAMHVALAHRLRGGHQLTGVAVVDGTHEITAYRNRVSEKFLVPDQDAVVLSFGAGRHDDSDPGADRGRRGGGSSGPRQGRCVEK